MRARHRNDLHEWYMRYDKSHNQHDWDYVGGMEHEWFGEGLCHYDNFQWFFRPALDVVRELESNMPEDEFNDLMQKYIERPFTDEGRKSVLMAIGEANRKYLDSECLQRRSKRKGTK